jgi:hypothetical protein
VVQGQESYLVCDCLGTWQLHFGGRFAEVGVQSRADFTYDAQNFLARRIRACLDTAVYMMCSVDGK